MDKGASLDNSIRSSNIENCNWIMLDKARGMVQDCNMNRALLVSAFRVVAGCDVFGISFANKDEGVMSSAIRILGKQ